MELKDILAGKTPEEQTAWLQEHMPDLCRDRQLPVTLEVYDAQ